MEKLKNKISSIKTQLVIYKRLDAIVTLALILFSIIILSIILSGCTTPKQRIEKLHVLHPLDAAKVCAEKYPPRVEHTQTIEYKQGKTDTMWQYKYIDCDTVIGETRIVKVPYPVQIKSKDTLFFRDSIFTENTAKLEAKNIELSNSLARQADAEKRAKKYKEQRGKLAIGGIFIGWVIAFIVSVVKK